MKSIVLIESHEHKGHPRPPGSELTLTDADAAWLIDAGKARAAGATPSTTKAAAAPKATESTQDKEQQA